MAQNTYGPGAAHSYSEDSIGTGNHAKREKNKQKRKPDLAVERPERVCVKALVCWATGKRLTNRLPKLSLITLSPPLNRGILGLRMGPHVPTPRFFYNLWGPRESDSSDS